MKAGARVVAAGIGLALIALTLGGCSAVGTAVKKVGEAVQASQTPKAGECWAASVSTIVSYGDWEGSPAVRCSERHDSYTYAVTDLAGTYSSKGWEDSSGDGTTVPAIDDDAWLHCSGELDQLLPTLDDRENRFYYSYFLPTEAQWHTGARWVRCDIEVISIGSLVSKPQFDPLPADFDTIATAYRDNPDKLYDYCIRTASGVSADSDPFNDASARVVDCGKSPEWTETNVDYFPDEAIAAYPSDDVLNAFLDKTCGPVEKDGVITIAYPPNQDQWKSGSREVECWSATIAGASA